MHIRDILKEGSPSFSFEFFPPRTEEGKVHLLTTLRELESLRPSFVSITYGAGGTTRDLTHDLVTRLKRETALDPIPHLTCVGHGEEEIENLLNRYAQAGISNILALRGDQPREPSSPMGDFPHAVDLVRKIRHFRGHHDPRWFGIGVAGFPEGHPETPNRLREMDHLKAKVEAGADYICTQLFFCNEDFLDFRERCELAGIRVPILAGIMPVTSLTGLHRMADLAGGTRFPARLLKSLLRAQGDPATLERIGIHYASEQCADLLHHDVAGIHFYTLNKSQATREIFRNLGLSRQAPLEEVQKESPTFAGKAGLENSVKTQDRVCSLTPPTGAALSAR